jgi:hypothetical protein
MPGGGRAETAAVCFVREELQASSRKPQAGKVVVARWQEKVEAKVKVETGARTQGERGGRKPVPLVFVRLSSFSPNG